MVHAISPHKQLPLFIADSRLSQAGPVPAEPACKQLYIEYPQAVEEQPAAANGQGARHSRRALPFWQWRD